MCDTTKFTRECQVFAYLLHTLIDGWLGWARLKLKMKTKMGGGIVISR